MLATKSKVHCNAPSRSTQSIKRPYLNVFMQGGHYFFQFLLPGIDKDQLSIQIENDLLYVDVYQSKGESEKTKIYSRKIALPRNINKEHTEAHLENGVLTFRIAKKEKEITKINIS